MKLKNLKADFNMGTECPEDKKELVQHMCKQLCDAATKGVPYAMSTVLDQMFDSKLARNHDDVVAVAGHVFEELVQRRGWREVAGWGFLVYKPSEVTLTYLIEGIMTRHVPYNVPELLEFIAELTGETPQQGQVNKVLQRLTKKGALDRVDRGVYKRSKRGIK